MAYLIRLTVLVLGFLSASASLVDANTAQKAQSAAEDSLTSGRAQEALALSDAVLAQVQKYRKGTA